MWMVYTWFGMYHAISSFCIGILPLKYVLTPKGIVEHRLLCFVLCPNYTIFRFFNQIFITEKGLKTACFEGVEKIFSAKKRQKVRILLSS